MLVQDLELIKAKVVGNGKREALAWVAKMQVRFLPKLREIMVNYSSSPPQIYFRQSNRNQGHSWQG